MPSNRSKSLGREEAAAVEAEMRKEVGFGSHTPREFSYLDFLPAPQRIYNVKLRPLNSNRTKALREYLAEIHGEDKHRAKSEIRSKDGHIWAFGSCTPRIFNYMEQINPYYRVYDVRLLPGGKLRSKTTMSFASAAPKELRRSSSLSDIPAKKQARRREPSAAIHSARMTQSVMVPRSKSGDPNEGEHQSRNSPTAVHPKVMPVKNVPEEIKKSEPLKIVTPSEIQIHETEATPRSEELMEISPRSQEAQESEPDDSHEIKPNRQFNEHHAVQDHLEVETFQLQNQNDQAEHEGDHEEPASPGSQHSQPDSNDGRNAEDQRIPSHHLDPMQQSMILDENENLGDHDQVFHPEAESADEDHQPNGHYENDDEEGAEQTHFEAEERKLIHENEDFPIHSANQDELNAFGETVHRRLDSDHEIEETEHSHQSHGFQNNAPKTRYSSSGSSQDAQRDNQKRASIGSYEGDATVM